MKVSREVLLALSDAFAHGGEVIDDLQAIGPLEHIGEAVAGSELAVAVADAGPFVEGAYLRVAGRLRDMSAIADTNATDYEGTEQDFVDRMAATGFRHREPDPAPGS